MSDRYSTENCVAKTVTACAVLVDHLHLPAKVDDFRIGAGAYTHAVFLS